MAPDGAGLTPAGRSTIIAFTSWMEICRCCSRVACGRVKSKTIFCCRKMRAPKRGGFFCRPAWIPPSPRSLSSRSPVRRIKTGRWTVIWPWHGIGGPKGSRFCSAAAPPNRRRWNRCDRPGLPFQRGHHCWSRPGWRSYPRWSWVATPGFCIWRSRWENGW